MTPEDALRLTFGEEEINKPDIIDSLEDAAMDKRLVYRNIPTIVYGSSKYPRADQRPSIYRAMELYAKHKISELYIPPS